MMNPRMKRQIRRCLGKMKPTSCVLMVTVLCLYILSVKLLALMLFRSVLQDAPEKPVPGSITRKQQYNNVVSTSRNEDRPPNPPDVLNRGLNELSENANISSRNVQPWATKYPGISSRPMLTPRIVNNIQRYPVSMPDVRNNFIKVTEYKHRHMNYNWTAFGSIYKLSSNRSSIFDFPFIINSADICKGVDPFLVMLVLSVPGNRDERETIRQGWETYAKHCKGNKRGSLNENVRLVFLLGIEDTASMDKAIHEENIMYGDIVQADFQESYFNLTRKVVNGIRWVAEFCPNAKYILKTDEDTIICVSYLLSILAKKNLTENGTFYGQLNENNKVFRADKYAVSKEAYPHDYYPPYTAGYGYVMSGHLASHIFYIAGHLPYLNMEDVFVSGIVRGIIGADIENVRGFAYLAKDNLRSWIR